MTDSYNPLYFEAVDPGTAPARLAEIAGSNPDLHPAIAANPACYPALLEWMRQLGTLAPAVSPAPAATSAYALQPGFAEHASPFGSPAASSRRRRSPAIIWGSLGLVVLMLAGGGVWAYAAIFSKIGGSATPQAAVEKLLTGAASMDLLSVYGSLAPSEVESFKAPIEALGRVKPDSSASGTDYSAVLDKLRSATHITVSNLSFDVQTIDDGIAAVTVTGGQLVADGDPNVLADAVVEAMTPVLTAQYSVRGYSKAEITRSIADYRTATVQNLDEALPYDLDAGTITEDRARGTTAIAVQEGGSWYVSPLLTSAEVLTSRSGAWGSLVAADTFSTPEAAAKGLADGVTAYMMQGDTQRLAAALPLPERRLVSLYSSLYVGSRSAGEFRATNVGVTSAISGDTARLRIDDVTFAGDGYYYPYSLSLSGVCAKYETDYANNNLCLDGVPGLSQLGVRDVRLIAVREGDGWLVSPLRTAADAAAIAIDKAAQLNENGQLDNLFSAWR